MSARGVLKPPAVAVVKHAARLADRVRPPADGVVVLAYHQVGAPRPGAVNLPLGMFEAQMEWLAHHAEVVDLDAALARLAGGGGEGARPVVSVTFDDGTADFVEHAFPVLSRLAIPVTLYAATAWIDQGRSFWNDGTVLTWPALQEVVASGLVSVGSHTHSHLLADRTDPVTFAADLDRSVDLIADRLGVEARHFAYPKALPPRGAELAAAVAARFSSAALAGSRPNPYGASDPYRLERTPIQVADGSVWFADKARGGMRLEGELRRLAGRWRYRGADR